MKKYRVESVEGFFGIFLDDIIEAEDDIEAKEQIMYEIMDNIGNYLDIEVEEIFDEDEDEEDSNFDSKREFKIVSTRYDEETGFDIMEEI